MKKTFNFSVVSKHFLRTLLITDFDVFLTFKKTLTQSFNKCSYAHNLHVTDSLSCRETHLLLGRVVDGRQSNEAADVLSIFLKNNVIPADRHSERWE